jgi:hypothetical protein
LDAFKKVLKCKMLILANMCQDLKYHNFGKTRWGLEGLGGARRG